MKSQMQKKTVSRVLVLVLGLMPYLSFAGSIPVPLRPGMTQISSDKLPQFSEALADAVDDTQLDCVGSGINFLGVVETLNAVFQDRTGIQPVLQVIAPEASGDRDVLNITTDATYRRIIKVEGERQSYREVNHGDLMNPNVEKAWVATISVCCK